MINLDFYKTGDGTKQFWGDDNESKHISHSVFHWKNLASLLGFFVCFLFGGCIRLYITTMTGSEMYLNILWYCNNRNLLKEAYDCIGKAQMDSQS